MKHILVLILLTQSAVGFGQNCNWDAVCRDTVVVKVYPNKLYMGGSLDSSYTYRALKCAKFTNIGVRIDIGGSRYYYNSSTSAWLGNHGGPSVGFVCAFKHWNIGFRFKPWTVHPGQKLAFNSDTLAETAKLNPVKLDYFVGYSVDFKHNVSVEPYIGYTRAIFEVINEEEIGAKFSIPSTGGLIFGLSINKYFKLKDGEYIGTFANVGYAVVDYKTTHTSLGVGYSEWTLGMVYKGFFYRQFNHRIP